MENHRPPKISPAKTTPTQNHCRKYLAPETRILARVTLKSAPHRIPRIKKITPTNDALPSIQALPNARKLADCGFNENNLQLKTIFLNEPNSKTRRVSNSATFVLLGRLHHKTKPTRFAFKNHPVKQTRSPIRTTAPHTPPTLNTDPLQLQPIQRAKTTPLSAMLN